MSKKEITERIECLRKTIAGAFEKGSIDFDKIDAELAAVRDALADLNLEKEASVTNIAMKGGPPAVKTAINSTDFK